MTVALDPEHDAPDCPNKCGQVKNGLATPIGLAQIEHWDGPDDATLFCPICGGGWVGTPEDVARAEASFRAYAAKLEEREPP